MELKMVIESNEEFSQFLEKYKTANVILVPMLCESAKHPANSELSFLFVKLIGANEYYILPFNHNECINLDKSKLNELNVDNKKYVFDKKSTLHVLPFKNLIDINLMSYIKKNSPLIDFQSLYTSRSHLLIEKLFDGMSKLCCSMPIMIYYENLIKISDSLEEQIKSLPVESEPSFIFLNNDTIDALYSVEKEGLHVNSPVITEFFPQSKRQITKNDLIYTQYNIYTATGRPANKFGNINFAALKKENGERASFNSRFGDDGMLVVFDYDAYHLRLMAEMVGYEFPDGINIHEYLGKLYFGKDTLTEEEYAQSKEVSFQLVYGGIDKSVADAIPFFGKVKQFIDTMWQSTQDFGYAETVISKKKIYLKNFDFLNRNKIFNYVLQNYETEKNMTTILEIQKFLLDGGYSSKLVLYLYDGFLIDMNFTTESKLIGQLRSILEKNGYFPTKVYTGKDFHNMKKIE